MLLFLPRLGFLGRNEASRQGLDLAVGVFDLPVEEPDARNERRDMRARGFDRSGGDVNRRPAQGGDDGGGVEAADAIAFEQLADGRLAQTACLSRRRCGLPEFEQPFGAKVVFQFEHGGKVAPELLAQAVGEAVAFDAEVFGDARPLAQFDDGRVGRSKLAEAPRIGAQRGGHDLGVAAVVLGARTS